VPAAAVIPAPIAYIKVVAVKKLVVEFRGPFSYMSWLGRTAQRGSNLDGDAPTLLSTGLKSGFSKTTCALYWVAGLLYSRHLL
jgi:hypothetical protein